MRATGDPKGYYRILGVPRTASAEEIKAAFRERAKAYHPDHGGELADEDRFRMLKEAYEALRDPHRRLEYDALGLNAAREAHASAARDRMGGGRGRAGGPSGSGRRGGSRSGRLGSSQLLIIVLVLVVALVGALGLWWSAERQVSLRNVQIADLYYRLNEALAAQAETRTRYRASTFSSLDQALQGERGRGGTSFLFSTELVFPNGRTELDPGLRKDLDRAVVGVAEAVRKIPEDRDWVILVEGYTGKAAAGEGIAIEAWEKTLLRIAVVVEHMVAQGLPAERLASRFQAGFAPTDLRDSDGRVVEVKLLCCFK